MPTISLSDAATQAMITQMATAEWSPAFISVNFGYYMCGLFTPSTSGDGSFEIRMMQGTVPTNFSTLTTPTSRSSDILIQWTRAANQLSQFVNSNVNPIIIGTGTANAVASGTATWFWGIVYSGSTIFQQYFGTVGALGSGADLEISSTSIVSGNPYRINNLRWQMPSTFTY